MARKKDATEREVDELLGSLLGGRSPEEIMGVGGLLGTLTKRVVERALEGELTDHWATRSTQEKATTAATRTTAVRGSE